MALPPGGRRPQRHGPVDDAGPQLLDPQPPRGGIILLLVRRTRSSVAVDGYRARFPVLHGTPVLITDDLK